MIAFPKHAGGLTLKHNPNAGQYIGVSDWIEERGDHGPSWESEEFKQEAIRTQQLWTMSWFPDTPVGSYYIAAPTLESLIAFANSVS